MRATTASGEDEGSRVSNLVQGRIASNRKAVRVTYDAGTMWHSGRPATGWVSVEVELPCEVPLTRLAVHSQHSGQYHIATAARVFVRDGKAEFKQVAAAAL